jgi:hypothetical protein
MHTHDADVHEVVWEPCGTCWGQRAIWEPLGGRRALVARACPACLGLGERGVARAATPAPRPPEAAPSS